MYCTCSPDILSIPECVKLLQHILQEAHKLVHEYYQTEHSRQKMLYNRKVHQTMYQVGDMIVLHSCIVPRGKCRKLHNLWAGSFGWKISLVRASTKSKAHFDRLKPILLSTNFSDVGQNTSTQNHEPVQQPVAPLMPPFGCGSFFIWYPISLSPPGEIVDCNQNLCFHHHSLVDGPLCPLPSLA